MRQRLREKGYPESYLQTASEKVENKNREDLFMKKVKTDQLLSMYYILTYNPLSHVNKSTVIKHWPVLFSDKILDTMIQHPPLFTH